MIDSEERHKKAPLSKTGYTTERHYTLQGAFNLPRSKAARLERKETATVA